MEQLLIQFLQLYFTNAVDLNIRTLEQGRSRNVNRVIIDGRIGILQEFIQGCHIQKYDEQSCGQIGKVLAQLHKLSIKYTCEGTGLESGTVIKPDHLEKIEIATIKDVRVKMLIQNASAFEAVEETYELEKYFRGLQEIN